MTLYKISQSHVILQHSWPITPDITVFLANHRYAHSAARVWEGMDREYTANITNGGCKDIAQQVIDFGARFGDSDGDGLNVIMGGGRR